MKQNDILDFDDSLSSIIRLSNHDKGIEWWNSLCSINKLLMVTINLCAKRDGKKEDD